MKDTETIDLQTLIDKAILEVEADEPRRGYLGASVLAGECERALWYDFRWWIEQTFLPRIYRRFETGHTYEPRVIKRLVDAGFKVNAVNPNARNKKKQWRAEWAPSGGLLGGHMDGLVRASEDVWRALGASDPCPSDHDWVVLEAKAMASAKYMYPTDENDVIDYDAYQTGNKANDVPDRVEGRWWRTKRRGVKAEHQAHYGQMQAYMGLSHEPDRNGKLQWEKWNLSGPVKYALYVAINTDTEQWHAELVRFRPQWWERMKGRAMRIFRGPVPERISENPGSWKCRFCDHRTHCHNLDGSRGEPERISCRSCVHADLKLPNDADNFSKMATWFCKAHKRGCGDFTPCEKHEAIPTTTTLDSL